MAYAARFWDKIADGYAKRPVADPDAYERKLATTRQYLRPEMEVLELGCGTGTTALKHAPHVARIDAVDISAKMIEIASRKAVDAGAANVTFHRLAVDEMTFPAARYDAVMAHSLLHLVDDRTAVLAEIHRMLKPGGHLIASTACLRGKMPLLQAVLPVGRVLGLLPKVAFFTPADHVREIENAGFRIEHSWQPSPKQALFVVAQKH